MGVSPMLVISSGRGLTAERGDNGVDIVLALSKKNLVSTINGIE